MGEWIHAHAQGQQSGGNHRQASEKQELGTRRRMLRRGLHDSISGQQTSGYRDRYFQKVCPSHTDWVDIKGLRDRTRLVVCSAEFLPFREECFDAVLCSEVVEHLDNPRRGIMEISRVLGKDGKAILTVPNLISYYWTRRGLGYDILRFLRMRKRNRETERHTCFPFWRTLGLVGEMNLAVLAKTSTNILPVPFSLIKQRVIYAKIIYLSELVDSKLRQTPLGSLGSSFIVIVRKVARAPFCV